MSELVAPPYVDRQLFSLHEEEDVTEITAHRRQVAYLETSLRLLLPDRFVGANLGVYWVPGQYQEPWAGPDVLVGARSARVPLPRVWVVWEDGPLQFVAEVASEKTRRLERKKRQEIYQAALAVPECLYIDLDRRQLELWRLDAGKYRRVREQNGRLQSEELGVWFGWDLTAEFVRIWDEKGRMLPTPEEQREQLAEAEQRVTEEARLRQEAEERAAALAAELERLRRGV
jgi:hypothetical protein